MEIENIIIPKQRLGWSEWFPWRSLIKDARKGGVKIPNGVPGVYEAKYLDSEERLTIGKASDLRMRIRQGLIKGKVPHSAGDGIRKNETNMDKIIVRWAETDRPAAIEEELHKRYKKRFERLPRYVKHT